MPWPKGKPHSPESNEKRRVAMLGNQHTKGYRHTEEWKLANSIRMRGNKHAIGNKHTEEWKRATSERLRGNSFSVGKNLGNQNAAGKGRKPNLTAEARLRRSVAMRGNRYGVGHGRPPGTPQPTEWRRRMSERFSGKGNPAYVDGLGLERGRKRNQQRNTLEYRLWRSSVFHRDGYTCVMCGGVEALQADHIEGWAVAQQKRYDVENGRTLCAECHRRVTWGGALRTL